MIAIGGTRIADATNPTGAGAMIPTAAARTATMTRAAVVGTALPPAGGPPQVDPDSP